MLKDSGLGIKMNAQLRKYRKEKENEGKEEEVRIGLATERKYHLVITTAAAATTATTDNNNNTAPRRSLRS